MYYYGGGSSCGQNMSCPQTSYYPTCGCGNNYNNSSIYAIILVLFILLVIVIGTRWAN